MKSKKMVYSALMIALVFVVTYLIKIPLLAGYFNVGDVIIMLTALLFGKTTAFLAGSFGSALSDIVLGFIIYAPFTFIIKGFEGYITAALFNKLILKNENLKLFISTFVSGLFMAFGYFICEAFFLKTISSTFGINKDIEFGLKVALVNLPFNILQGVLSSVIATILGIAMLKNPMIRKLRI